MADRPKMTLWGVVLDAPAPRELAAFYEQLLGWERRSDEDDWVTSAPPTTSRPGLSFQYEKAYVPPVWPAWTGDQQLQVHLDILVENVEESVAFAVGLGARLAEFQPQEDVRVLLDPVGHPFCLFAD